MFDFSAATTIKAWKSTSKRVGCRPLWLNALLSGTSVCDCLEQKTFLINCKQKDFQNRFELAAYPSLPLESSGHHSSTSHVTEVMH